MTQLQELVRRAMAGEHEAFTALVREAVDLTRARASERSKKAKA